MVKVQGKKGMALSINVKGRKWGVKTGKKLGQR
jgi:hypothetical protein